MAAKFVVLALAVCSASANVCLPCFQPQESAPVSLPDCFSSAVSVGAPKLVAPAPVVVAAPAPTFVSSGDVLSDSTFELAATSGSNGPSASSGNLPVLQAPPVTLNAVESPVIRLPSPPVPSPRVIRHRCYCTKTVVRPQVIQRTITVPRIQRYLKQSYRPIVENVSYQARPVGSDSQGEDIVIQGNQGSSSSSPVAIVSSGLSSGIVSGGLSSGIVSGGVISGVISGSICDSESSPAPSFEASSPCEPVVQSFPRCY
ncbi:UNVERIFIED_CONTAM: hypothetical protein PYX00_006430 [Menopon gallinae]|uniref:Uncharacterized protein n=1 Tax=Menopon gallinae TaxID=328185 RepID=A0AAW2HX62_9NEOP